MDLRKSHRLSTIGEHTNDRITDPAWPPSPKPSFHVTIAACEEWLELTPVNA
jgi:hypothetical protein